MAGAVAPWDVLSFFALLFLKSITIPAESLAHWDGFLQRGKIWGFEASDAHGGFRIGSWFTMKVPSYADTFSFVGMGISRRFESDPEAAVRGGDFFSCIRGRASRSDLSLRREMVCRIFRAAGTRR